MNISFSRKKTRVVWNMNTVFVDLFNYILTLKYKLISQLLFLMFDNHIKHTEILLYWCILIKLFFPRQFLQNIFLRCRPKAVSKTAPRCLWTVVQWNEKKLSSPQMPRHKAFFQWKRSTFFAALKIVNSLITWIVRDS